MGRSTNFRFLRDSFTCRDFRIWKTPTQTRANFSTSTGILNGGVGHEGKGGKQVPGTAGDGTRRNNGDDTGTGPPRSNIKVCRSWELHSYSSSSPADFLHHGSDLQLASRSRLPILKTPTEVMVHVHAASVNPIDVAMTKGYGRGVFNLLRGFESETKSWTTLPRPLDLLSTISKAKERIEFPLILGRDFAGVVSQIGHGVKDLKVGDEVYGVCRVECSGCHSDYVVTPGSMVRKKPRNLNFVEAASLPYVGLTSWSAIWLTGGYEKLHNKKLLVLGGSGGVGSFLIQYLKAHGSFVVSTCSSDAVPLVESLGCDFAVDYKQIGYAAQIKQNEPFDCIFDLTGSKHQSELIVLLKPGIGQYITLSPPFLSNVDKYGLCGGLARNLNDIIWDNWKSIQTKRVPTKWAFFIPFGHALDKISALVEERRIKPVIQEMFNFDDLPAAYKRLDEGHARGKLVIDFQTK